MILRTYGGQNKRLGSLDKDLRRQPDSKRSCDSVHLQAKACDEWKGDGLAVTEDLEDRWRGLAPSGTIKLACGTLSAWNRPATEGPPD
ncbi:hypothetical protein BaRGS_00000556 [Batillaria attramentaria]|uniref:Uncharacterized protein n=1 Tax=Batillaria attramentaria TaxID=370345 RepID=A0ABD0MAA2_9CAEN